MFLPDNIDLAQSEKYSLSIRLSPNGFSFLIFLSSDKSVHYYNEISFSKNLTTIDNIKKIFFEANLFSHQYSNVIVSIVSPRYTIVPNELFEKSKAIDYFNFNIYGDAGKVLTNHVKDGGYNIVWDIDEEKYSFLFRGLWNAQFTNFTTHFITYFKEYGYEEGKKRCFVDFHDDMATIVCFDEKNLLSVNTYITNNKYDIIYNIVNIWEKHPFNQNDDYLFLSGNVNNNWETIDILKKLIRNVNEIAFPDLKTFKNSKTQIPTDLLVQVCE